MDGKRVTLLLGMIEELKYRVGEKMASKLKLDKCFQLVEKLHLYEDTCETCQVLLLDLENQINKLVFKTAIEKPEINEHNKVIAIISSHLQRDHKLVTSGYYVGVFMSLGVGMGIIFGLTLLDNMGIGLAFGAAIGVLLGVGLDASAKKKGHEL